MSISPFTADSGRFGPVEPSLDHLVYAVPDLDLAAREFAAATGVTPAEGGRHLRRGIRNVLVGFGETSYLEIIGPGPDNPADPGVAMPYGLDTLTRPRLVTWAVHPTDIEVAAAASPRSSSTGAPPRTRLPRCPGWRCAACGPPTPIRQPWRRCSTC